MDRNGEGKVSRKEFPRPLFDRLDTNNDGHLTLEEVRRALSSQRAMQMTPMGQTSGLSGAGELGIVEAVFELCVRDVEACVKFYREGIRMREVEPATATGTLLEWAGCYLRLRKVPGGKCPPPSENPMRQILTSSGPRRLSLWFKDPESVVERLVKAGYPAPLKAGNVSMTWDPDGNVVETMSIPRTAATETFTWGMNVSDEMAARKFHGDTLGLQEFAPWNLPATRGVKMYLFAAGAGRIKFSSPPGQRSRDSDAGPDPPGLRSVTLRVADLAAARRGLEKRV